MTGPTCAGSSSLPNSHFDWPIRKHGASEIHREELGSPREPNKSLQNVASPQPSQYTTGSNANVNVDVISLDQGCQNEGDALRKGGHSPNCLLPGSTIIVEGPCEVSFLRLLDRVFNVGVLRIAGAFKWWAHVHKVTTQLFLSIKVLNQ